MDSFLIDRVLRGGFWDTACSVNPIATRPKMKNVVRLGDATSHGGKVMAASATALVNGIAVARQGDACLCPIQGHTPCVIIEGDPTVLIDGVPVAFHGHKTSCGATLISSTSTSGTV